MGLMPALERILAGLGYKVSLTTFFVLFGLASARLVMAVSFAPFLGGQAVPARVRVGLAAILAAVLYPNLPAVQNPEMLSSIGTVALLVKEILIGAAIGLASQFVFLAVQTAGILIDTQRGMNQIAFVAPQLSGNVSVLGQFQFQAAIVMFLALDGHLLFLRALSESFRLLPMTSLPHFPDGGWATADLIMRLSAGVFVIAIELSAPVLVALFLVDVCFGALGKVASQVQVHMESQPVKALAGLAVLFLSIGLVFDQLRHHFGAMLRQIENLVRSMG